MKLEVYGLKDGETPYDIKDKCDRCGVELGEDEYYFCDRCEELEKEGKEGLCVGQDGQ